MDANKASMTALAASLIRALHTRSDPAPIIDDPWGDRFVPQYMLEALYQRALAESGSSAPMQPTRGEVVDAYLRANAAYTAVVTRTRYAEDALHAAVDRGTTQYVLIGAGFDSYALRVPVSAQHLAIFEVDHPATQGLKMLRLRECGVDTPARLQFVAADLSSETLTNALSRTAFDHSAKSFFSWLGVSMYLTREANMNSLRSIAACGAPGSELVFTYLDQSYFDSGVKLSSDAAIRLRAMVASMGEPFVSGFHPHELEHDLAQVGLELLEDLADRELVSRYDRDQRNGFTTYGGSHVARARVK